MGNYLVKIVAFPGIFRVVVPNRYLGVRKPVPNEKQTRSCFFVVNARFPLASSKLDNEWKVNLIRLDIQTFQESCQSLCLISVTFDECLHTILEIKMFVYLLEL